MKERTRVFYQLTYWVITIFPFSTEDIFQDLLRLPETTHNTKPHISFIFPIHMVMHQITMSWSMMGLIYHSGLIDYNGVEDFLSPNDITAIEVS